MTAFGETREYRVVLRNAGFSYTVPLVQARKDVRVFGLRLFSYWRGVWEGDAMTGQAARRMKPEEMMHWLRKAYDDYKAHREAWEAFATDGRGK